jgi:hypothetical protein
MRIHRLGGIGVRWLSFGIPFAVLLFWFPGVLLPLRSAGNLPTTPQDPPGSPTPVKDISRFLQTFPVPGDAEDAAALLAALPGEIEGYEKTAVVQDEAGAMSAWFGLVSVDSVFLTEALTVTLLPAVCDRPHGPCMHSPGDIAHAFQAKHRFIVINEGEIAGRHWQFGQLPIPSFSLSSTPSATPEPLAHFSTLIVGQPGRDWVVLITAETDELLLAALRVMSDIELAKRWSR